MWNIIRLENVAYPPISVTGRRSLSSHYQHQEEGYHYHTYCEPYFLMGYTSALTPNRVQFLAIDCASEGSSCIPSSEGHQRCSVCAYLNIIVIIPLITKWDQKCVLWYGAGLVLAVRRPIEVWRQPAYLRLPDTRAILPARMARDNTVAVHERTTCAASHRRSTGHFRSESRS